MGEIANVTMTLTTRSLLEEAMNSLPSMETPMISHIAAQYHSFDRYRAGTLFLSHKLAKNERSLTWL